MNRRPGDWLQRAQQVTQRWLGGAAPASADAAGPAAPTPAPTGSDPSSPPWLAAHADKVLDAAAAAALVRHGDRVYVGSVCATPRTLVAALEALDTPPGDVELVHFLTDGAVPHDAQGRCTSRYRHRSFFVGADIRAAVRDGQAEYVPLSLAQLPGLIANGRVRVDVALLQVSPPDEFGYVSLGLSVDATPAAVARARLVVAEVNAALPRTAGDAMLHVDDIDHLVPVAAAAIEYAHPAADGEVVQAIARYVGSIVDDGSTLQIGLGRYAHAALALLHDRRHLGVHSDVVTDAVIPLLESGALTGRRKTHQRGKIVCSFAMGSRRLYDLIDRNPLFVFQPIDAVCDPAVLAAQHRLVSITQAFAIDLGGQVCVERLDGRAYGGLAAQPEFMQGAARSAGGRAIVCLASTSADGTRSQVRAVLDPGEAAGIARSDVHYVVTEYGIAYLFGKSLRERALALIALAHPRFRAELLAAAQVDGTVAADQRLKNLQAYAVAEERTVTLKDGRTLLLRPAVAGDDVGVRELFHQLSDRDVYTRFFRKIKGLSNRDVQQLCNLDFDGQVAFVAVDGPREDARVVGHACYFVDAATRLAETAFMVHPAWQGSGLASALQRVLAAHARGRGVMGFVAEILATNDAMIRLARGGDGDVDVASEGSTVRVTTRFR